jgi:hypothetical protein
MISFMTVTVVMPIGQMTYYDWSITNSLTLTALKSGLRKTQRIFKQNHSNILSLKTPEVTVGKK